MYRKPLVLLSFVVFGCFASDGGEADFRQATLGESLTLLCKTPPLSWSFEKNDSKETVEDGVKFKLNEDKTQLTVEDVGEEQLGVYSCIGEEGAVLRSFEVDISLRLKKLPKSMSVDDGAAAEITCSLKAAVGEGEEVVFTWWYVPEAADPNTAERRQVCSKGATDCTSINAEALFDRRDKALPVPALENRSEISQGVDEEDNTPFSRLRFDTVYTEDRQTYICRAVLKGAVVEDCEESKECDETFTLLRVKDPMAALWPFIGIVVEVVILCAIIFFCEKGKKEEKEDYDEHIRK